MVVNTWRKKKQTSGVRQVVCSKPLRNDRKGGETREEQREVEKGGVREREVQTDRQQYGKGV